MGHFPSKWSEGLIVPLHKKGDVNSVDNYRGITLLSSLGKLFTRVLNNRLTWWAEAYGVYIEAQAGFRPNYSTIDNLYNLNEIISYLINKGKTLYCAFLDFCKAFDYGDHNFLWSKLLKLGIRGEIFFILYVYICISVSICILRGSTHYCAIAPRE